MDGSLEGFEVGVLGIVHVVLPDDNEVSVSKLQDFEVLVIIHYFMHNINS